MNARLYKAHISKIAFVDSLPDVDECKEEGDSKVDLPTETARSPFIFVEMGRQDLLSLHVWYAMVGVRNVVANRVCFVMEVFQVVALSFYDPCGF